MPDLDFKIVGMEEERFAVLPTLLFALKITADRPVENITLRCQVRIEPARRGYEPGEQENLSELFGEKKRWGQTLRSFLWDHVTVPVPPFARECTVKLPLACSYDFDIAATKYFHGLEDGEVPLIFLFSGSVFYKDAEGLLQIAQVSWSKETSFAMPVAGWKALMARYYPDTRWLRIPNPLFDRLYRYKRDNGFNDWEAALDALVPGPAVAETAP